MHSELSSTEKLAKWQELVRSVAGQFGRHPFTTRVTAAFGKQPFLSHLDAIQVLQMALDIMQMGDDENHVDLQEAGILLEMGVRELKLGKEEEGIRKLKRVQTVAAEACKVMKHKATMVLRHWKQRNIINVERIDKPGCRHGRRCFLLRTHSCKFFHPKSHQ